VSVEVLEVLTRALFALTLTPTEPQENPSTIPPTEREKREHYRVVLGGCTQNAKDEAGLHVNWNWDDEQTQGQSKWVCMDSFDSDF